VETGVHEQFYRSPGRVSPVDPRDIARVACTVLTQTGHEGRAYDVTGPELLTVAEMVQILSRVLGKPIRYVEVPETTAGRWMAEAGMPPTLVAALVETLGCIRTNRFAYVADTLERLTGHHGRTYEQWCQQHVVAFDTPR
jgi:uncharacterized protein YbjT (DUF2867 family)